MTLKPATIAKKRPAETTAGLAGAATAGAALLGATPTAIAVIGTAAGMVPTVVTYLATHGGARGVITGIATTLWRGHRTR